MIKKLFACCAFGVFALCLAVTAGAQQRSVVVSTSMLESSVREIIPAGASLDVVSILPPSACPGHFDLSPRVLPLLKSAALVIRHDYQGILDDKIAQLGGDVQGMSLAVTTGSPLIPHHYYLLAENVSSQIAPLVPGRSAEMTTALSALETRTDKLAADAEHAKASWQGGKIIAATNAIEYCEWLGFTVAGELKRPEDTTPQDFANLMRLDADLIVANLQEGTDSAFSLGERMGILVAVISNFRGAEGFGKTYDDLFTANLDHVRAAWLKR